MWWRRNWPKKGFTDNYIIEQRFDGKSSTWYFVLLREEYTQGRGCRGKPYPHWKEVAGGVHQKIIPDTWRIYTMQVRVKHPGE